MAIALRSLQQSMNGGGFTAKMQQTMYDIRPVLLQNYLTATSNAVNASTAMVDPLSVANGGFVMGNCLQVELGETVNVSYNNTWKIRAFGKCTTTGAAGLQLQLQVFDGLTVLTSFGGYQYTLYSAAGVVAGAAGTSTPFTSGAVNIVQWEVMAMVQITGYGRLGLQFTQAVSTATNTTLSAGSYIEAVAILP